MINGKGKVYYINKDVYEGEFVNGHVQGYGETIFADGGTYKGDWIAGQSHGYGVEELP